MSESGTGKIHLFNDFCGVELLGSATTDTQALGDFFAGGEGFEDAGPGVANLAGVNGTLRLTGGATDADMTFIGTAVCFDVGLQGTLVAETRVSLVDLDTKVVYFGFTSVLTIDEQMNDLADANTTTMTLTAGQLAGFIYADTLDSDEEWHFIHNGGTTGGQTDSTQLTTGVDAIAGEFDVLRVEIDTNGTARFYVNGDIKGTVTNAVSTTVDLAVCLGAGANSANSCIIDADYLLVKANRDWTR